MESANADSFCFFILKKEVPISEFLWWLLITIFGVGFGIFVGKLEGALFMAIVCAVVGAFTLFERKTHPNKSSKQEK